MGAVGRAYAVGGQIQSIIVYYSDLPYMFIFRNKTARIIYN